jgi:hypothetical protein
MKFIKIENNTPAHYSLEQLFVDYPDAIIHKKSQMPNPQLLATYNVYPLITEAPPHVNEDEALEESTPEFTHGEWHQTWRVRKLSATEIQEIIDSKEIYMNTEIDDISKGLVVDKEQKERRSNLCKSCDYLTSSQTCVKCNCIIPLKIKLADASCPLEKW